MWISDDFRSKAMIPNLQLPLQSSTPGMNWPEIKLHRDPFDHRCSKPGATRRAVDAWPCNVCRICLAASTWGGNFTSTRDDLGLNLLASISCGLTACIRVLFARLPGLSILQCRESCAQTHVLVRSSVQGSVARN